MRKCIPFFSFLILLFFGGCQSEMLTVSVISVRSDVLPQTFTVSIADTPEKHAKGLQGVGSLGFNEGMWFVFEEATPRYFWMKDTLIPLDIVFIGDDSRIIHIVHNAPPCTEVDPSELHCPSYYSEGDAQYVLEVAGGTAEKYRFSEDDFVFLNSD